jgi:hypothetical protein
MSRHLFLWAVLILCAVAAPVAQDLQGEFSLDEELLEAEEEEFDAQEILEKLAELRRGPLDPNRASFSQLQQIPYLSAFQIRSILESRKKERFQMLEDMLRAPGMDAGTLARARPFLKIRASPRRWGRLRSRLALTLPTARGYRQGIYRGDPAKIYLRLDMCANEHLRLGILCEKDPGEKELTDYRSFYLQAEEIGPLQRAVMGNFSLEFGQGLVLWTGGGASGGAHCPSAVKKVGRGLRSYTSANENAGLCGMALTSALGPLALFLFLSGTRLDASLEGDGASSFYGSGLHRSQGELDKKDTLEETLTGAHLSGRLSGDKVIGLTWYRSRYRPGLRVPDRIRRRYAFRGEISQVLGVNLDMVFGSLGLFGEVAVNQRNVAGAIVGLLLDGGAIHTAMVWRHYPPEFCNPHGSALTAKDGQNEHGMLLGLVWRLTSGSRLELLMDQYRRPWRSYLLEMPSKGEKWSLQAVQKLGSGMVLTLRHREQRGEVAMASALGASKNVPRHRRGRRLQFDWKASRGVEVRGRLETSRVFFETKGTGERGALLHVQLTFSPWGAVKLRGMVTCFRVPTYQGRMYLCEVGPPGAVRNVALFGRGCRAFFLARCETIKGVEVSARFCSTHYDDRQSLGDGLEEIEGDVKREMLIQLDWSW